MKILTLTGTRPELIRLSVILKKLDDLCDHIHVYSNQNFDPNLSDIFFRDLQLRAPNYTFKKTKGIGDFLSNGFKEFDEILDKEKPDKMLVLGDTNSGLLSILAAKKGIPVYHMEAGNRCYDGDVPEETNRKVIDACSTFNLPYTENSKQNLINERFHKNFVFKTGNPILEVLCEYRNSIEESPVCNRLGLEEGKYVLLSFHRTENVDDKRVSTEVMSAINTIAETNIVVFPMHPRTRDQFKKHNIHISKNVIITEPLGFFDFCRLEELASVVITDSGTVPEETCLSQIPCIVLRNTTERQELMEKGSFLLAGTRSSDILRAFKVIKKLQKSCTVNEDYAIDNVSEIVINLLLGQSIYLTRRGHDEY